MKAPGGRIAAVVLAAGRSSRMGAGRFKLTEPLGGIPVIRRVCETALQSRADEVVAVTGFRAGDVRAALAGLDVRFAHNPDFAAGLSASLRTGVEALNPAAAGCLICLGDMPLVRAGTLDALIASFQAAEGPAVRAPRARGKRGNPVLWSSHFFAALAGLEGDQGGRAVAARNAGCVQDVDVDDDGVLTDADTPAALDALASKAAGGVTHGR